MKWFLRYWENGDSITIPYETAAVWDLTATTF